MSRNKEGSFQDQLISIIENETLPNSIVLKNDSSYIQGFPDLTVLAENGFVVILECKRSENEKYQPNQEHYLKYCSEVLGYYTATIYPENAEEILYEIQQASRCEVS